MAKMPVKDWEGSAEDERQDKILAKKHKESFKDWEASDADTKHDRQQSMKGLKKGGAFKLANPMGARAANTSPTGPGRVPKSFIGKAEGGAMPKESTTGPSTVIPTSPAAIAERRAFEAELIKRNSDARAAARRGLVANPPANISSSATKQYAAGGVAKVMPTSKEMGDLNMKKGGAVKKCAKGGGIERKGKTNTKMVKMAKGGSIDGIAQRGKTRCTGAK